MEVEFSNITSFLKSSSEIPVLKSGDQIVVRVVKRAAPFRYLVSYRGQKFKVNSSVLLNSNDKILLELVNTQPRFKFKFVANLRFQQGTPDATAIERFFGFGKNLLGQQFVTSSLAFSRPIKKTDFRELKKFLLTNQIEEENYPAVLILHQWFQTNFNPNLFSDTYFLMRWLLKGAALKEQKEELKKVKSHMSAEDENSRNDSIIHLIDSLENNLSLKYLMAAAGNLKTKIERLVNDWKKISVQLDDLLSPVANNADAFQQFRDVIGFLSLQFDKYNRGEWIVLPIKDERLSQNFLVFMRSRNVSSHKFLEFSFLKNSHSVGLTAVQGEIESERVKLELLNNDQDFKGIVDNHHNQLKLSLKKIGLHLTKFEINSGKNIFEMIGKTLTENEKINVRW